MKKIALAALAALGIISAQPFVPALAKERATIVVFGDSLSAGYRIPRNQAFPAQLQRALRARGLDVEVINASRSGRTTAGGVRALRRSLLSKADGFILQLGGNDGLRGVSASRVRANLDTMLQRLTSRNIPVLLAGIGTVASRGDAYARQFASLYAGLARKYRVPLDRNFLSGVYGNRALMLRDGIHPNVKGVSRMVRRVLPKAVALTRKAIARNRRG